MFHVKLVSEVLPVVSFQEWLRSRFYTIPRSVITVLGSQPQRAWPPAQPDDCSPWRRPLEGVDWCSGSESGEHNRSTWKRFPNGQSHLHLDCLSLWVLGRVSDMSFTGAPQVILYSPLMKSHWDEASPPHPLSQTSSPRYLGKVTEITFLAGKISS